MKNFGFVMKTKELHWYTDKDRRSAKASIKEQLRDIETIQ